ncbi:MAG: DUF6442 family protein [Raoultibacter sp.]
MDKQEILEKSRRENGIADGREKQVEVRAASIGMWAMFVFAIIFGQVRSIVFGQSPNDIMAVAFFGAAATFIARYYFTRYRGYLAAGIIFTLGMLLFLGTYILRLNGIDI